MDSLEELIAEEASVNEKILESQENQVTEEKRVPRFRLNKMPN